MSDGTTEAPARAGTKENGPTASSAPNATASAPARLRTVRRFTGAGESNGQYTAYTFIAVPALVYAVGAAGFYALSYTIMVWPIVFVFGPRLWSVARARGYVSPGEFVRGRPGSQGLGLAVAATGILATMPYIALQLVGIQSVLTVLGVGGNSSNVFIRDLPLDIA